MTISSTNIKSALQEYDRLMGTTGYAFSSLVGEYKDVSDLRTFCKTLANDAENLTPQATLQFIEILIDSIKVEKEPHDNLFVTLKALVAEEKLTAFSRLKSKKLLNENFMAKVDAHANPQSTARMITHFTKNEKELSSTGMESFLEKTDPYHEIKTSTATKMALAHLSKTQINTEANQNIAKQNPIIIAKILKKLISNNILVTNEVYLLCAQHSKPVNMTLAVIELNKSESLKESKEKVEIINQAKAHSDPLGFIQGVVLLEEKNLNTKDNRAVIAQSNLPETSAELFVIKNMKDKFNKSGMIASTITRGVLLFGGITNPIGKIDSKIKGLEDELATSLSSQNK